jgi:hypothetical protein
MLVHEIIIERHPILKPRRMSSPEVIGGTASGGSARVMAELFGRIVRVHL